LKDRGHVVHNNDKENEGIGAWDRTSSKENEGEESEEFRNARDEGEEPGHVQGMVEETDNAWSETMKSAKEHNKDEESVYVLGKVEVLEKAQTMTLETASLGVEGNIVNEKNPSIETGGGTVERGPLYSQFASVTSNKDVEDSELRQRFWAVEAALRVKGSGKGKSFEERLWQFQQILSMKGSGKGKPLHIRLQMVESALISSLD
jgi:hypothetical protein